MEKCFDAFLYLANWGTHELMFRLPRRVLDVAVAKPYCCGETAKARVKGDSVILQFLSDDEEGGDWDDDGSGWLSSIIPLRADLASDGSASLQPVYEFSASPSDLPASSEYSVQFLDDQGKVVSEYPVSVMRAEEKGHKIESIHARLPRPSQPYSSIQVVHNGQSIASRAISSQATQALAPVVAPTTKVDAGDLVLNWANGVTPTLVRYTSDGGQSWITVGVDVSGSELRLAVADLPAMPLQFQVIQADGLATATVDWTP